LEGAIDASAKASGWIGLFLRLRITAADCVCGPEMIPFELVVPTRTPTPTPTPLLLLLLEEKCAFTMADDDDDDDDDDEEDAVLT
jgi:hypothetical protein